MSLLEVARFNDVYEAELAAAFLASHDIPVTVTERYQTTVDPLMQRALGIRLMSAASQVGAARELIARVRAGDFATDEGDDIPPLDTGRRMAGTVMALAAFATGGFWGNSLPRRFRAPPWQGMVLSGIIFVLMAAAVSAAAGMLLDPP